MRKPPAIRKEAILDEALRLIGQRGYNGFTIRELAMRCGLSNAGMLHYFASKNVLLNGLLDHIEECVAETLSPHIDACWQASGQGQSMLPVLHDLLEAMMAQFISQPEMARFLTVVQVEAIDPAHPAHTSFRNRENAAILFLQHLLERDNADPEAVARGLHGAMQGLGQQWLRSDGGFDLMQQWRVMAGLLLPH